MDLAAKNWPVAELMKHCSRRPAEEAAWQEFVSRFHSTIVSSVTKAYRYKMGDGAAYILQSPEKVIDDLVQAVYFRLVEGRSKALKCFEADQPGSIYQYLGIISCRTVFNYVRVSHQPKKEE
jgi:DNA-directed RNA polymerase specialized sigma24 family protein